MKNYIFLTILIFVFLISCEKANNRSKIILRTTDFSDSTKIYLANIEKEIADSGYIINNLLVFVVNTNELTHYCVYPVIKTREEIDYRFFWKENKRLTIIAKKGHLKEAKVQGSEIQKQADILDANKAQLRRKLDSVQNLYRSLPTEDTNYRMRIKTEGKNIEQALTEKDVTYIKNHPNELYSAITLENIMRFSLPKNRTKELYDNLNNNIQSSKYGLLVRNYLQLSGELNVGDKAIDFQLPDLNGKIISLNKFKGKYVLLDFWYSNCGPCRKANPNLLKNYRAYRDKGFEIIGISFDKNRELWESTIKKDSIAWITVSDLQGTGSDIALTYHINSFPTYYLIDPKGIIIEKIEDGSQLGEKLKVLFKN